jgi:hypothetical protein
MLRSLCNALVWVGLMIGLPSALYAMTMAGAPGQQRPKVFPHDPAGCSICRVYRHTTPESVDRDLSESDPDIGSAE